MHSGLIIINSDGTEIAVANTQLKHHDVVSTQITVWHVLVRILI